MKGPYAQFDPVTKKALFDSKAKQVLISWCRHILTLTFEDVQKCDGADWPAELNQAWDLTMDAGNENGCTWSLDDVSGWHFAAAFTRATKGFTVVAYDDDGGYHQAFYGDGFGNTPPITNEQDEEDCNGETGYGGTVSWVY